VRHNLARFDLVSIRLAVDWAQTGSQFFPPLLARCKKLSNQ